MAVELGAVEERSAGNYSVYKNKWRTCVTCVEDHFPLFALQCHENQSRDQRKQKRWSKNQDTGFIGPKRQMFRWWWRWWRWWWWITEVWYYRRLVRTSMLVKTQASEMQCSAVCAVSLTSEGCSRSSSPTRPATQHHFPEDVNPGAPHWHS